MRLILSLLFVLIYLPGAKANSCSGTGYLQNSEVTVLDLQFYACRGQGLLCFNAQAIGKQFKQKIELVLQFYGDNFTVIETNGVGKNGNQGQMEYNLKSGHRRLYVFDENKNKTIDFIYTCL